MLCLCAKVMTTLPAKWEGIEAEALAFARRRGADARDCALRFAALLASAYAPSTPIGIVIGRRTVDQSSVIL